ncbi:MAG: hypothetical protein IPJ32_01405 [Sphingobacteriaceae bacterium]|nr:hypothetical protein [Sphingobacteriaceae bacterium]
MKILFVITPVLFVLSSFSQNVIQTNFSNSNPEQRYIQVNQVFASNMMGNTSNTNKPIRANANPQVQVQRATNASSNQRRQVRRVVNNVNTNVSNVIQPQIIVLENNMNDDIQLQQNFSQQLDNNLGNAFGNENMIEQIASVNIPAIQVGTGSLNLNLELPSIKMPSIKFAARKSVSSSKRKTHTVKKKLAKLNRKMTGKLSFRKKLKIKVDNCFKW